MNYPRSPAYASCFAENVSLVENVGMNWTMSQANVSLENASFLFQDWTMYQKIALSFWSEWKNLPMVMPLGQIPRQLLVYVYEWACHVHSAQQEGHSFSSEVCASLACIQ